MPARPKPAAGQRRSRSELRTAAYRRGRSGRPAHDWIRQDPAHLAAYDQGRAEFVNQQDSTDLSNGATAAPAPPPAAGGSQRVADASSKARDATGRFFTKGDGGGLLLAFVLYPIALSVLKHGAQGPLLWFRAKWLNETPDQPNNLGPVTATRQDPYQTPGKPPGTRTPGDPNTPPIPPHTPSNQTPWGPRPPGWQGPWPPGGGSQQPGGGTTV